MTIRLTMYLCFLTISMLKLPYISTITWPKVPFFLTIWKITRRLGSKFKYVLFLDVGLSQAMLGLDLADWFLRPFEALVNKGPLVESFVGQEILAYSNINFLRNLKFLWVNREIYDC